MEKVVVLTHFKLAKIMTVSVLSAKTFHRLFTLFILQNKLIKCYIFRYKFITSCLASEKNIKANRQNLNEGACCSEAVLEYKKIKKEF